MKLPASVINIWTQAAFVYKEHGYPNVHDHIIKCVNVDSEEKNPPNGFCFAYGVNLSDAFFFEDTPFECEFIAANHNLICTIKANKILRELAILAQEEDDE
jgi:hypothetical protein